ncbi:hypothetical protein [Streptomyces rubiginosohelvolus]|uniref:Uncharacterized protein n=1 Tax=Streptomyces rubiginosohelvolus TaxID=67362 RepID=A0ABQ3CCN4_9ACTN|nr:hypothetical protein [Streptomyces pluricolorescens]GGZ83774.1 hypothetical protein GCM10010328_67500 [Streptomyces pluricolorescens]
MNHRSTAFAAAYALLRTAADHADHWGQSDFDAQCKGATDTVPVEYTHEDGTKVTVGTDGGRRACLHHVLQYCATQGLVLVAGTRVLGIRLHPAAVAAALAISGLTHYAADRRVPQGLLQRLAKKTGKERFYKLSDFGMNGAYCLDQSWHHSWETLAAAVASIKADAR